MQQNTDPTQKYGTPQSAPSSKLVWMGWMMIGIGLIWLFSGSLSVFLWIIRDFGQENVWTEILLQGHIALAMNALVIVAGILMLKGKRSGYVMALASCIYWVGSALFFLFYIFVQYPIGIFSSLGSILGLSFPPNASSMATLAINVLFIVVFVGLFNPEVRRSFVNPGRMTTTGIVLGIGIVSYTILCTLLKHFVFVPEPDYFQF
ncbi:MAG: hypothetical protein IPN95_26270 [Bacteroidetes bacterium]|nr:hypothetical protein [Bacteroidota bacterium]